jgi:putative oxidoreductase
MVLLSFLSKYSHQGLLLLRLILGSSFVVIHGYPKLAGGPEKWAQLGMAALQLGLPGTAEFWGFMAAFAEFGGGLALVLGLFFRPFCLLLVCTMAVAVSFHLERGDTIREASHAIEVGATFLALVFLGPGKFSLDAALSSRKPV